MKRIIFILLLSVFLSTTAVGETLIKIEGSDTICRELVPALATAYMNTHRNVNVTVQTRFSSIVFMGLFDGNADIVASTRPPGSEEKEKAKLMGNDLDSVESEHIIGFDGIAVIVNPQNPVNQLTVKQVRRIFSGEITDWESIGGSKGAINVLIPDPNSDVCLFFKQVIIDAGLSLPSQDILSGEIEVERPGVGELSQALKQKLKRRFEGGKKGDYDPVQLGFSSSAQVFTEMEAIKRKVSSDVHAIVFVEHHWIAPNKALNLAASSDTPYYGPTDVAIRTGRYPLSRKISFYTLGAPKGEVRNFINYVKTDGQQLVSKHGFTSLKIETSQDIQEGSITKGYRKFETDIRFRTASSELDNLAIYDLKIIARTLIESYPNAQVLLIGYADSRGGYEYNVGLSVRRAEAVKSALVQQNISVNRISIKGMGPQNPIGDNSTPEGRQLNRRVEIYFK
jgi:phosphate transport system substrate-binding protein